VDDEAFAGARPMDTGTDHGSGVREFSRRAREGLGEKERHAVLEADDSDFVRDESQYGVVIPLRRYLAGRRRKKGKDTKNQEKKNAGVVIYLDYSNESARKKVGGGHLCTAERR